jgi:hypothetical protein
MNLGKTFRQAMTTIAAIGSCWLGTAGAVPTVWTDEIGALGRLITPSNPYSYQHVITDGANGYRPGTDSIYYASLSLWLYDDAFFGDIPLIGDGKETVGFRFDNGSWISAEVDSLFYSLDSFDFTVTSLVTDGLLNVTVKSYRGDFGFGGSRLTVIGDRVADSIGGSSGAGGTGGTSDTATSNPVPEPATLALFGLGLLGIGIAAGVRRRRLAKATLPH